jgi:hypothetical protein
VLCWQSKSARLQRRFPILQQHLQRYEFGSRRRYRGLQLEVLQQFQCMPPFKGLCYRLSMFLKSAPVGMTGPIKRRI